MMSRLSGDWRVWLLAVLAGYLYFVEIAPNWTTFRYRMTVEIDTPAGVKTGSSVVEYVRRPALNVHGTYRMLFHFSTREGTLLRAQHWTRGLATIIEIGPAGWVVIPRRPPYGVYKIQPGQLNSSLPRIEVPFQDGFSAYWIPYTDNLEAAHYTTAGEIKKLAEGVKMKTLIIEPTSAPLLTRISDGDPPWVVKLRSTGTVRISNRGRGRTSLHIRNIESGWQFVLAVPTINTETLMRAVLAMDVYHREYNWGVSRDPERDPLTNSTSDLPDQVGNWFVGDSDPLPEIGFMAQAYTNGGQTILSFRGTDDGLRASYPLEETTHRPST